MHVIIHSIKERTLLQP